MAAFTKEFDYDANQLLFNLDVPARDKNLAFHINKPEPIIIERFGPNTVPAPSSPMRVGNKSMQFSAVSEDSLNMAVQLAKRDLKKQKEKETMRQSLGKKKNKNKAMTYGRSRSPVSPSRSRKAMSPNRTKITHSKEYKEKLKKRAERDKARAVALKERERGWNADTKHTRTRNRDRTPPEAIIHFNNMPATTNSPPTRDNSACAPLTGDDKIMHEIKRLRDEMDKCMKQIKKIEQVSKAAPPQEKAKYAEDIEEEKKRKIRAEEQTVRSSRMIYMLNQQVKDIQAEIDKMNAMGIKQTRKSQILTRLAAAHRGAVRVLQNFVAHLPDYDLREGVPRSYQELGMLLRQLSLCCAQLEVAGQTGLPAMDNIMFMLKDMADLNQAIDQSITRPKSPPRLCQVPKEQPQVEHRSRSPKRREVIQAGSYRSEPAETRNGNRKKEVGFEDDINSTANSAFMVEKLEGPSNFPLSDREQALKAGIQALVQAADSAPPTPRTPRPCNRNGRKRSPVPPLDLPVTPRTPHSPVRGTVSVRSTGRSRSPADILRQRNQKIKKGLLIPSQLQAQRDRAGRQLMDLGEAHYAEPTFSTRMKEVKPNEYNRPGSPISTRRSGSLSPTRGISKTDVARQVWLDRENSKRELFDLESERKERQRIEDVSVRLGRSGEWVSQAEKRIKAKLEPLLSQAEVEVNADLLADMIMKDMVEEAANDLKGIHEDRVATHDAMAMQDAPSLETMLQKIKLMEEEQGEIRRRWATIAYEDTTSSKYKDSTHSERPRTPQPIQLTRNSTKGLDPVTDIVDTHFNTDVSEDGAIMFTKSKPYTKGTQENLQLSSRVSDPGDYPEILQNILYKEDKQIPIRIYLTEEIINNIMDNKERFSSFLKKMNYQAVGRFNPWHIVEEIADEIMADCLEEVSQELWEINNEIVEHTYKTEFKTEENPVSPDQSAA